MYSGRSLRAKRLDWRLTALALALTIIAARPVCAQDFGMPPAHFKILNENGTQVIGHGRYEIVAAGNKLGTAVGENRFNNGEYDIERDRLAFDGPGAKPRMLTYEHRFYAPDGSIEHESKADFATGQVSCIRYVDGKPDVKSATLKIPPDAYAGSVMIVRLREELRRKNRGPIALNDVNCVPGPRVVKVRAYAKIPSRWRFYPGELTEITIEPDLGWLNLVLAPFIPEVKAWFDPSDRWAFVGGNFQRYFRGPKVILARVPTSNSTAAAVVGAAPARFGGGRQD